MGKGNAMAINANEFPLKGRNAEIKEETLSDGSKVYSVIILSDDPLACRHGVHSPCFPVADLPCFTREAAETLLKSLRDCVASF
jgi:hypothetical protein